MSSDAAAASLLPFAPKQARSELSTRRLLDAAAELIAEVGYERATLAAIGERAGYSHGLVTRRFGSKERLLETLVDRMTVQWTEQRLKPSLDGMSGLDRVIATVEAVAASVQQAPREMRALYLLMFDGLRPVPVLEERMRTLHRGLRRDVERSLKAGQTDGSVAAEVDVVAISSMVVSVLRGAAYQWLLDPDRFDLQRTMRELVRLLDTAVRAPAPRRRSRGGGA